jgi:hypothetical protein
LAATRLGGRVALISAVPGAAAVPAKFDRHLPLHRKHPAKAAG